MSSHDSGEAPITLVERPEPSQSRFAEAGSRSALDWKLLGLGIVLALFIVPTLVSYSAYYFTYDDSDYLMRSINVSKAFWSADRHEMISIMAGIRPPVMTLLGLPWGPLSSWDAAGKCFITLTAITSALVACCLFLLLRIGLRPLYLVLSSACLFAVLGPYPSDPRVFTSAIGLLEDANAHFFATAFMADTLFAWNAFAALLLIIYESRSRRGSTRQDLLRGVFWGLIFSLGAITKVSFLYFLVLIIPILVFVRIRQCGSRSALVTLTGFSVCSFPVVLYWLRYGLPALRNGWAASFGHDAPLYALPFSEFVKSTIRQSPGFLVYGILVMVGIGYLIVKRKEAAWGANILPVLIAIGFCAISFASSNRQLRYSFVGIIALPYLIGILIIGNRRVVMTRARALVVASLVFCCALAASVPLLHRPKKVSILASEAVLATAHDYGATRVLLATDSTTLNDELVRLALAVSPPSPQIHVSSLAWSAALGVPIEDDYRRIRESDLVIFQDERAMLSTFNQRVLEYEQYIRQNLSSVPTKEVQGLRIYKISHD